MPVSGCHSYACPEPADPNVSRHVRFEHEQLKHEHAPNRPHHYLTTIGVHAAEHGQGIGKALLPRVHQFAAEVGESSGVALNTEVESNIGLYRHFGYEGTGEAELGPVHLWFMFRPNSDK
ncbi:MAG: GNAT family N-acetyltransferase [Phycisphaerae bacterium]